jgi:hypothetical protein
LYQDLPEGIPSEYGVQWSSSQQTPAPTSSVGPYTPQIHNHDPSDPKGVVPVETKQPGQPNAGQATQETSQALNEVISGVGYAIGQAAKAKQSLFGVIGAGIASAINGSNDTDGQPEASSSDDATADSEGAGGSSNSDVASLSMHFLIGIFSTLFGRGFNAIQHVGSVYQFTMGVIGNIMQSALFMGQGEGHHWTPLSVLRRLFKDGLIDIDTYNYMAGRTSGPLINGHGWSKEHSSYNKAVEKELRDWAANGKKVSYDKVVDNISKGKSYDGKRTVKEIDDFLNKVRADMPEYPDKNPWDSGTPDEIRERGASSIARRNASRMRAAAKRASSSTLLNGLKGNGKGKGIKGFAGAAAAYSIGNDAVNAAQILTNGEGINLAFDAAYMGDEAMFERALIGQGEKFASTWEELKAIDPVFADFFAAAVRAALDDPKYWDSDLEEDFDEENPDK